MASCGILYILTKLSIGKSCHIVRELGSSVLYILPIFSASKQFASYAVYPESYANSVHLLVINWQVIANHIARELGEFITLYSCKGLIGKMRHAVYSQQVTN